MRQQINLYQPTLSETRHPMSFLALLAAVAVMVGGLGVHSWLVNRQVAALEQTVADLQARHAEQEALLATAENSPREDAAALEQRVRNLERTVHERHAALEILRSGAAGQTLGFAARMEALARRHVDGLWIDTLVLSGTNGSMSLGGGTLDPDIVPTYLRNLAQESILRGTRFDDFVIERSSEAKDDEHSSAPHVRFRAGNKALETDAAQEAAS
ncbi:MAG TPA: hypothetical protein VIL28_14085 [Steroidobacteraceae bacterium]